eukprot:SAG31_NODE_1883_length_6996_cov_8.247499_5_plen_72_part_00
MPATKVPVKVTLPRTEAGFGMNIDAECSIASFTGPDTVAEQHGVKLGSRIISINGKRACWLSAVAQVASVC